MTRIKPIMAEDLKTQSEKMILPAVLGCSSELFLNREKSLLEFFRMILEEAQDPTQPLLERLKFISIFASHLDEFFMIRVSGLKEQVTGAVAELSADAMTPAEQLRESREMLLPMIDAQARCLIQEILPELKQAGIEIVGFSTLSPDERKALNTYFMKFVFPVLTPMAVDSSHPFPYISALNLNLGLMVDSLPEHGITSSLTGKIAPRFARIKVPPLVPRLVPVQGSKSKFVYLEDLIAANISELFPRMRASECHPFRLTRDAEVEIREVEAEDLLRKVERELRARKFGTPVRLEVGLKMPQSMIDYLRRKLELDEEDVYVVDGPLNVGDLMELYNLHRLALKDTTFRQRTPTVLGKGKSIFDVLRNRELLLHHPYDSYTTVTDFIAKAAEDDDVLAIKICLYRTGANSPIPKALIEASERGKQVAALVELKARFDEENNIEWARQLEEAGVHVVYGIVGLKTHCKLTLVVRREDEGLRRYVHIATGNYNPTTSTTYTDLGLFTTDEEIGEDATDLFNFLTGYSRQKDYHKLMVSPANLRQGMLSLIERETEHARAGRPSAIIAKFNRLADTQIIRALYEASQAGVQIDLIVRGICVLRPGVPGLSETIRVRSIIGRFLEHHRIFYFANGGNYEVFIGSADWMTRNLSRRIEVVTPIESAEFKKYLKEKVLAAYLRDNVKARLLRPDGSYERARPAAGEEKFNSQLYFFNE